MEKITQGLLNIYNNENTKPYFISAVNMLRERHPNPAVRQRYNDFYTALEQGSQGIENFAKTNFDGKEREFFEFAKVISVGINRIFEAKTAKQQDVNFSSTKEFITKTLTSIKPPLAPKQLTSGEIEAIYKLSTNPDYGELVSRGVIYNLHFLLNSKNPAELLVHEREMNASLAKLSHIPEARVLVSTFTPVVIGVDRFIAEGLQECRGLPDPKKLIEFTPPEEVRNTLNELEASGKTLPENAVVFLTRTETPDGVQHGFSATPQLNVNGMIHFEATAYDTGADRVVSVISSSQQEAMRMAQSIRPGRPISSIDMPKDQTAIQEIDKDDRVSIVTNDPERLMIPIGEVFAINPDNPDVLTISFEDNYHPIEEIINQPLEIDRLSAKVHFLRLEAEETEEKITINSKEYSKAELLKKVEEKLSSHRKALTGLTVTEARGRSYRDIGTESKKEGTAVSIVMGAGGAGGEDGIPIVMGAGAASNKKPTPSLKL